VKAVRVLVVEDEPLPRRALRGLIEEIDWLELVGEAADGVQAVERIDALHPDLVFLDVQMPEISGIEVLNRIAHRPAVVFTTAFDRYAVAAFELEAIDYLIKPFGRKRFRTTIERVRRRLADDGQPRSPVERIGAALNDEPLERIFARVRDRIVPLQLVDVTRIEACDDYSEVHSGGKTYLLHLRLQELEQRLDPRRFVRVHRSHLINLDHVVQMRSHDDRRLSVELGDGSTVVASRAGSQKLRRMAG
jgi:two-component system LytT family response regulator